MIKDEIIEKAHNLIIDAKIRIAAIKHTTWSNLDRQFRNANIASRTSCGIYPMMIQTEIPQIKSRRWKVNTNRCHACPISAIRVN